MRFIRANLKKVCSFLLIGFTKTLFYCIIQGRKENYGLNMKVILASKSPRRKEILSSLGLKFDIIPAVGEEIVNPNLTPKESVLEIAKVKAFEIFEKHQDCAVIGADTIVVLGDEILQKPRDNEDEYQMLCKLSGKTHLVYTGYALLTKDKQFFGVDESLVTFNDLSEEVKQSYVKSGLGLDKAGGYGIQDGFGLVKEIKGSYYNIVGFPKEIFEKLLTDLKLI